MLLLVTIGLVLVGTVSLVIGFVSGHQGPIYITIVCSLVAGTTLAIFSRMSRRAAAGDAAPSTSGFTPETSEPDVAVIEDEPTQAVSAVAAGADFPIDDYDELLVSEILPVLPELDLDELDQVRDQEAAGKNRSSIIKRIDQLIDQFEDDGGVATPDADLDEDLEDVAGEVEDDADEIEGNPIPGYGKLSVAQILPLLDDLSDEDLDAVALYEEQHDNRKTIIEHIDSMFEEVPVDEPAPVKKAPAKTAAKKAPAKASAKKAPAKAVAKTPAKTAAKKAPAKTAAKKAPAKAASKTVAATKATAKKAPAKKTAAKSTKKR